VRDGGNKIRDRFFELRWTNFLPGAAKIVEIRRRIVAVKLILRPQELLLRKESPKKKKRKEKGRRGTGRADFVCPKRMVEAKNDLVQGKKN